MNFIPETVALPCLQLWHHVNQSPNCDTGLSIITSAYSQNFPPVIFAACQDIEPTGSAHVDQADRTSGKGLLTIWT